MKLYEPSQSLKIRVTFFQQDRKAPVHGNLTFELTDLAEVYDYLYGFMPDQGVAGRTDDLLRCAIIR